MVHENLKIHREFERILKLYSESLYDVSAMFIEKIAAEYIITTINDSLRAFQNFPLKLFNYSLNSILENDRAKLKK